MKRKRIGTRNYYLVPQVHTVVTNEDGEQDICTGCALGGPDRCPEGRDGVLLCQELENDKITDYIFIPATKQGLVDFAIHRLETA
jgi:hypothetical protein